MRHPDATSPGLGQAAVYRVASELLFRGLRPYFPCVDDHGVDLSVGPVRLQVKSAHLAYGRGYKQGAYWFKLVHGPIVTGSKNVKVRGPRQFSQQCDFVVLMGIDEQRFWIVPAHILDSATLVTLCLGPEGFYKRDSFDEAKKLRAQGLTQQEIGDRLGISQVAVSYQLRGGRAALPKRTRSGQVRECEGKWDLIGGALATLNEANKIASEIPTTVESKESLSAS